MNKIRQLLRWAWANLDATLAFLAALVSTVLGATGTVSTDTLLASTLAVLTILAIGQIRARSFGDAVKKQVDLLALQAEAPINDSQFCHGTDERNLISSASHEVWMIQETGNLISEVAKKELLGLLSRGGHVRAVLTAPVEATARLMALRNANLDHDAIIGRSQLAAAHLRDLVREAGGASERLTVRYIPYPVSLTMVVADPQSSVLSTRKALARFAGFRVPFADKPDITVSGAVAPVLFKYVAGEARRHYLYSSKVVVLTGKPRSGKTTLLRELVDGCSAGGFYYALSMAQWDGKERAGFEVVTARSETPETFATRKPEGSYDFQESVWERVTVEITAALEAGLPVVLDEIGPIQLRLAVYQKLVRRMLDDPTVTLIATVAHTSSADAFLNEIFTHPRVSTLFLEPGQNETEVKTVLGEEMDASLTLSGKLPKSLWR